MNRLWLFALCIILGSACHTMRFGLSDQPHGEVVHDHNSFFFWGLAPVVVNDVLEHCPNGAVAVREQTTFGDGLVELLTLGLWSMRSSWYYCAPAGAES